MYNKSKLGFRSSNQYEIDYRKEQTKIIYKIRSRSKDHSIDYLRTKKIHELYSYYEYLKALKIG